MAIKITDDGAEEVTETDEERAADERDAKLALLRTVKLRGQDQMRSLRFNVDAADRKKVLIALKMAQISEGAETYAEAIVIIANAYIKAKKVEVREDYNSQWTR